MGKEYQEFNKKMQKMEQEQQNLNSFNSVTEKRKPENQNQQHNARKEGIGPINQKKQHPDKDAFLEIAVIES